MLFGASLARASYPPELGLFSMGRRGVAFFSLNAAVQAPLRESRFENNGSRTCDSDAP